MNIVNKLKSRLAEVLCATLTVLSPGMECYAVAGAIARGPQVDVGASAVTRGSRALVPIAFSASLSGVPSLSVMAGMGIQPGVPVLPQAVAVGPAGASLATAPTELRVSRATPQVSVSRIITCTFG